jgi:hypothetical protein
MEAFILVSSVFVFILDRVNSDLVIIIGKLIWLNWNTSGSCVSIGSSPWVEGCKLVPSCADLLLLSLGLISTGGEGTAHITTGEWNTEHVEVHDSSN